jgi:hypothetical protein
MSTEAQELAQDLAQELKTHAQALETTFAKLEHACLDVGAGLGQAIPGLADLAALFESLTQALNGDELTTACSALRQIADELTRAAQELNEESLALTNLVRLNRSIGDQLANLLSANRTISALVFSMKIEAAPLSRSGDDLAGFAEGLQDLSERARHALEEYRATYEKLDGLLRSSCEAQNAFQRSHEPALAATSGEIAESLGDVADLRRRTLATLQDIGAQSRQVSERIGQCVLALQIGDSTRQRVEHVHATLGGAADRLEETGEPEAVALFASRLCRLQELQLEDALAEFSREMATISASLAGLSQQTDDLAQHGRSLFSASDMGRGSFLDVLARKLTAAQAIVEECRQARSVVDAAAAAVATTMVDLQDRTTRLLEIIVDVTIIGTNALLKSTRLGDRGKGISVIAQELRIYSDRIVNGIKELPPALDRVVTFAHRFSNAGRSLDSGKLGELDERMSVAIKAFGSGGQQMSAALARLREEADGVRGMLDGAAATLAEQDEIGSTLESAATGLGSVASRLGNADSRSPEVDAQLDQLRPAYTMQSERVIHDGFTGYFERAAPRRQAPVEDLAVAFML